MDLHGQIMNLPADGATLDWANTREAYLYGHRDARHAAAELALKADACVQALRDLDARLKECSKEGCISAREAYDSFYQETVAEALAAFNGRSLVSG